MKPTRRRCYLCREMVEMKRKTEETSQKNEQELQVLRMENEEMKKKLGDVNVTTRTHDS